MRGYFFVTWLFVLQFSILTWSAPQCAELFDQKPVVMNLSSGLDVRWKRVSADQLLNLRSNVAAFWSLGAMPKVEQLLGPLLHVRGIGMGDFHAGNLADISVAKDARQFGLIDLDDGGLEVPLLLDFMRGLLVNRASSVPIETAVLIQSYIKGLKGERPDEEGVLQQLGKWKSLKDPNEYALKYVKRIKDKYRFIGKKSVANIDEAPLDVQQLFYSVQKDLESAIADTTILARGFRIKDIGGSQNRPRFWFFVKQGEEHRVIEMKFQPEAASHYYQYEHKSHEERLALMNQFYRPFATITRPLEIVSTKNGYVFLVREREQVLFDIETLRLEQKKDQVEKIEKFLAQWVGYKQASLNAPVEQLVADFEASPEQFVARVETALRYFESELVGESR